MIAPRYLAQLLGFVFFWCAAYAGLTLIVDPYGISPIESNIRRINEYRPKRVDIDRLIKPYEVWERQPRTVFLGTSRIHQSIDPAVLDGTRWAPAYNASIPASSLGLNIAHLKQYIEFDPKLRTVFVELFLYNFLGQGQERVNKPWAEFLRNTATLFASGDTLWASVQTLSHNLIRARPVHEIKPGGYFYYPPGHDAKGPFDGYARGIWSLHDSQADGFKLHEPAFEALKEIVQLCRQHELELVFLITPNHAYYDYYLDQVDAWPTIKVWLTRLASFGMVYSFAQPNDWVYEPVGHQMRYWNDPFHFSLHMGTAMLSALANRPVSGTPENFMLRMTPERIDEHVAQRHAAIRAWAARNPEFVANFKTERKLWEAKRAASR